MKIEEVENLLPALNDKKNALTKGELQRRRDEFDIKYIFDSSSFENSGFTYKDVCFLLEDHSRLFPDKDEHKRQTIINHYHAINTIRRLIKKGVQFDEKTVKDLHEILMDKLMPGGFYRTRDLFILGAKHVPPTYLKIYKKMERYFAELNNPELNGLKKAAYAHLEILKIYPFMDANGKLARLLLNYQLELEGFLPISITKAMRDEYYKTIDEYKINKDINPFTEFIAELEADRIKNF